MVKQGRLGSLRFLASLALVAMLGTGCSDDPGKPGTGDGQRPTKGAAALAAPMGSLDDIAKKVQESSGECTKASRSNLESLASHYGEAAGGAIYQKHVAEWGQCKIGSRTVGLFLFKSDQLPKFEEEWKQAIGGNKIAQNSETAFGNGWAVDAKKETIQALGLKYLRCKPIDELNAEKIPSDVDGCVFSNVSGM